MDKDEKKKNELVMSEVMRGRYLVTQKNNLAKSFGKLNVFEHKLLDYCISFIRNKDDSTTRYETTTKHVLEYFQLESSGKNYIRTANAFRKLLEGTTLSIPRFERGKLMGIELVNLFEKVYFGVNGTVEFTFSPDLKADLFALKKDFYAFRLEELSKIKSKYALILLKLWGAKRYKNQYETVLIGSVKEWQSWLLGDDRTLEPAIFKRDCLQKAVNELNKQEDMKVTATVLKNGRKVTGYEVVVLSHRSAHGELTGVIEGEVVEKQALKEIAEAVETPQEVTSEVPATPENIVDHFYKSFESLTGVKVSQKKKVEIALLAENFDPSERKAILAFAKELFVKHNAEKLNYLVTTLKKWQKHEVKTLEQAKAVYEAQNSKTTTKASKSNVPKWSKSDYKNPLDPKIIDELIEFHKLNGTLDTPGAQAEIAQRRAEIEQGRADLESRKAELLERLDRKAKS
jgi:plasmid replication initiation protein